MAGWMCCSRTPVREMDVYFRTKWTQGYQEFIVIHHHLAQGDDNLFSDKMMIFLSLDEVRFYAYQINIICILTSGKIITAFTLSFSQFKISMLIFKHSIFSLQVSWVSNIVSTFTLIWYSYFSISKKYKMRGLW